MLSILRTPLWELEVLALLDLEQDTDYATIMSHPQKFGMTAEELTELFRPYCEYRDAVFPSVQELLQSNQTLSFYLQDDAGKRYELLSTALQLLYNYNQTEHSLSWEILDTQGRSLCISALLRTVISKEEGWLASDNNEQDDILIPDVHQLISLLDESNLAPERKYQLTHLYLNQDSFVEQLYQFIRQGAKILKTHFPIIQARYEEMTAHIGEEAIRRLVFDGGIGLFLQAKEENEYLVYFSVFHYNGLSYFCRDFNLDCVLATDILQVGIFLDRLLTKASQAEAEILSEQKVMETCKALEDNSRFQILKLILQNKKMYLQELARELNISPATVSHHITALRKADLIHIVVEGQQKKIIYYTANRKQLTLLSNTLNCLSRLGEEEQ